MQAGSKQSFLCKCVPKRSAYAESLGTSVLKFGIWNFGIGIWFWRVLRLAGNIKQSFLCKCVPKRSAYADSLGTSRENRRRQLRGEWT